MQDRLKRAKVFIATVLSHPDKNLFFADYGALKDVTNDLDTFWEVEDIDRVYHPILRKIRFSWLQRKAYFVWVSLFSVKIERRLRTFLTGMFFKSLRQFRVRLLCIQLVSIEILHVFRVETYRN